MAGILAHDKTALAQLMKLEVSRAPSSPARAGGESQDGSQA